MFVFRKLWRALFSCNTDSPFCVIADDLAFSPQILRSATVTQKKVTLIKNEPKIFLNDKDGNPLNSCGFEIIILSHLKKFLSDGRREI